MVVILERNLSVVEITADHTRHTLSMERDCNIVHGQKGVQGWQSAEFVNTLGQVQRQFSCKGSDALKQSV
jgi:hypothetical protein